MTHEQRRTPVLPGRDLDSTALPDPGGSPSDISNDPSIWSENKAAAYQAALRGERDWQFAQADVLEGAEATEQKSSGPNSRPPSLRRVK